MAERIVFGPWSGGVTGNSAVVKVAVENNSSVSLLYSDKLAADGNLVNPQSVTPSNTSVSEMTLLTFNIDNLIPNTEYHYVLKIDENLEKKKQGKFKTFPIKDQAASFMFVCAGDAGTGSRHEVFESILKEKPLFFFHLGDLHYEDINENKPKLYRAAYKKVLNSKTQEALYRNVAIAYTWDDHDFSHNNASSTAPGRLAARLTYQECVPHYPLVAKNPSISSNQNIPIYQAFTVGRVRFLLTDSRSEKTPSDHDDDQHKTVLGKDQKEWLKKELLDGKDVYKLVVWVNSIPWIGTKESGSDRWFGYTTERKEIANFIKENHISNLCMISADAHMLAIDDGRNSGYASGGGGGFPVFHAASLDRGPSIKGGPYSHGAIQDKGQYGIFKVEDTGEDTIKVFWEGKHYEDGKKISFSFTSPRP